MDQPALVYLLFGEEVLLRERRAVELYDRFCPAVNPDYNRDRFHGPDLDMDRIVAACETLPVFDERRVVLVHNIELKSAAAHASFVRYISKPNPSTVLILTAGSVTAGGRRDKSGSERNAGGRAGKKPSGKTTLTVRDLVALIPAQEEFAPLRSDQASEFLRRAARTRGVELAPEAARLLLELVGVDAARLEDEIEKAALYAGARNRIEATDVEALVRQSRSHTVFELTDSIAEGNRESVVRHLHALLNDGNEPLALLGMVGWHFRRTLKGAALAESGAGSADIGRAAGVHYKMQEKFAVTCRKLGTRAATGALVALRALDRELKSAPGNDRIRLEKTLLELLPSSTRSAR